MLVLASLLGAGNLLWSWQQRLAADRQAEGALRESLRWQREGKLPEALAAVRPAAALADGGSLGPALRQRVQERQADLDMLDRLEEARIQQTNVREGRFDTAQAERTFEQAFRDYGLDVLNLEQREAVGKVSASSVRAELCTALAEWALSRRGRQKDDPSWKRLLALARAADADERRRRLWDALEREDLKALKELAGEQRVLELPPSALYLLGTALRKRAEAAQAVALLQRAQREYPDDFWINHELAWGLAAMKPPRWKEAIPFFTAAVALRPRSPGASLNLERALWQDGAKKAAAAVIEKTLLLKPDYAEAHCNRGTLLREQKRLPEAEAEFRKALELDPSLYEAHISLGAVLADHGKAKEAEDHFRQAIALRGGLAGAYFNLGNLRARQGRLAEAEEAYRQARDRQPDFVPVYGVLGAVLYHRRKLKEAEEVSRVGIRLKPDYAEAYAHLALALRGQGRLPEAEEAYRTAIKLQPADAEPYNNLGFLLLQQGRLKEAEAVLRQATERDPQYVMAFTNLAAALGRQGKLKEAEAAARAVIRLAPAASQGHMNLGLTLQAQGDFAGALAAFKQALELTPGNRGGRSQIEGAVRTAQQLVELDSRLRRIHGGEAAPAGGKECLNLARFCLEHKKLYVASARWYKEAFAAEPGLAEALGPDNRYYAASAAALAGCRQGKDAAGLDEKECARLRNQALEWLRADLRAWRQALDKAPDQARPRVVQKMQQWLKDDDFAGVRSESALAKLPEAEREGWRKLWADVESTLAKARGKGGAEAKPMKEP